jgi:hypothetical protein
MGNCAAETPIIWDYYEMLGFIQELRALHFLQTKYFHHSNLADRLEAGLPRSL